MNKAQLLAFVELPQVMMSHENECFSDYVTETLDPWYRKHAAVLATLSLEIITAAILFTIMERVAADITDTLDILREDSV